MRNARSPFATPYRHPRQVEGSEQQKFVNWVKREFPHVILFADCIGEDLTDTGRKRAQSMRTRRGIPDITILFPSRGCHGACFEFKKEGTRIYKRDGKTLRKQSYSYKDSQGRIHTGDHLAEQAATLKELRRHGYYARFVVGLEDAKAKFREYMGIPEPTEFDLPF
jgi:hypothetical protein